MWISFPEKSRSWSAAPSPNFAAKVKSATSNWEEIFLGKIWIHFFSSDVSSITCANNHHQVLRELRACLVYLDDLVLSPFYLNKFWVMMLRGLLLACLARQVARQQQHQPLSLLILPQQKRIYYELARYFLHHRRHLLMLCKSWGWPMIILVLSVSANDLRNNTLLW